MIKITLPKHKNDREYQKFVETDAGNVAVRVVGSSGSTSLDVSTNSVDVGGYIGKPTGQNGDFVTAYASATTITLSSLPSDVTAFYAEDIVTVEQYATDGSLTRKWTRDDSAMSFSGNTLTVDDAAFVATDSFVIYTNVPRPSGGGGASADAVLTSGVDFTAAYTSSTTITLSGYDFTGFTSSQVKFITVIPSGTTGAATYFQAQNGVGIELSSNVLTISGAGTPFASGDRYLVGINGQKKAYDSSTNSTMVSPLVNVWNQYTDAETLVTAQDLTDAYADFGAEIDMRGYNRLGVYIVTDVNDSETVTLQVLGKHTSAGTDEYEVDGISEKTLWTTSALDGKLYYEFDIGTIPFIQLQAKAGTVGASAGDLTIVIDKKWRD